MSKNDEETKRDIKVEKAKEFYTSGHRTGSLKSEWATEVFVLFCYF